VDRGVHQIVWGAEVRRVGVPRPLSWCVMGSAAHGEWQGGRADRLKRLFDAHQAVEGGGAPGRRWKTEQINWALTLILSAEFQGFARDLHIEAGEVFAREAAGGNAKLETILHARMTQNLDLDRGNAHPGSLGVTTRGLVLICGRIWTAPLRPASPDGTPR